MGLRPFYMSAVYIIKDVEEKNSYFYVLSLNLALIGGILMSAGPHAQNA